MGIELSEGELTATMGLLDDTQDGNISFKELLKWYASIDIHIYIYIYIYHSRSWRVEALRSDLRRPCSAGPFLCSGLRTLRPSFADPFVHVLNCADAVMPLCVCLMCH
jgi:hypothetical protein